MAVAVKTYDPKRILVVVGGLVITGFASGSMVEIRPAQAAFSDDYGVDGEPIRWANLNPYDVMTLNLMQTSPSNLALSSLRNADLATHASVFPVMVMDQNSQAPQSVYVSARAWIGGQPPVAFGSGLTPRRWTLRLLNTVYNTAGYDDTPSVTL